MRPIEKSTKRELKNNKMMQKELEELHKEVEAMNRKHEERMHPDSDSDNGYVDRKGKKWWNRFDERHFKTLSSREYQNMRGITTSDRILEQSPRETLQLTTFAKYKICPQYDLFNEANLVHVLYKSKDPRCRFLASYSLEQDVILPQEEGQAEKEEARSFKVTPCGKMQQENGEAFGQIKLALAGYNQDEQVCRTVNHYKRSLSKHSNKNDLELQVHLWQKQLHSINRQNQLVWDKLVKTIKKDAILPENQEQIRTIRDYLMWATVLKYFEHGFADKTNQQLQQLIDSQRQIKPAKSKDSNSKKFFETDCKICFCSFNYDSNQVLYCDKCNTSFHLACYGMQELPKEEIYYCDSCKENFKKLVCQLCNKTKFPIKEVQGHYYHVTCLMLFNLVCIENGGLTFRKGISHNKILQMVVESQLAQKECQFCAHLGGAEIGIRMKCCFAGCENSAHPICAYIYGCTFWVKKDSDNQKLDISYHCNAHNTSRDSTQQTYLRRYMCNFRKTSQLSKSVFQQKFQQQMNQMIQGQQRLRGWDSSKITGKTKYIKRKLVQEQQRQVSNPNDVQTETMKMLQRIKKKK